MTSQDDAVSRPPHKRRRRDPWLELSRHTIPLREGKGLEQDEEFQLEFLERVVRQDPCEESSLGLLGHLYTRKGEYEKGLEVDRRLARLRPEDPTVFYNLACSLSLTGEIAECLSALEKAVALGYRDLDHLLKDPDMANLREDRRFKGFCERVGLAGFEEPTS